MGSQIKTARENFAAGSAVVPTLSEGFQNELSDFQVKDATLKGDYLWQVVGIVIGGVPTIHEIRFMYLLMSPGRILLKGSVSTNLVGPMTQQVDFHKVEVGI
jgi:hypothetical protein